MSDTYAVALIIRTVVHVEADSAEAAKQQVLNDDDLLGEALYPIMRFGMETLLEIDWVEHA